MKKALVITLIVLFVIIGALGFIAPMDYSVEKRLVIDRPREVVFFGLKDFKSHAAWNPWASKDLNMKYEYKGLDGSPGFLLKWNGNNEVGAGEEEIKEVIENQKIVSEIRYKKPVKEKATSYFLVKDLYENQTEVTWGMKGRMGFPKNIFSLLFNRERQLGYDLDEGLRVFKAILEKDLEKEKEEALKKNADTIKESVDEISNDLKK